MFSCATSFTKIYNFHERVSQIAEGILIEITDLIGSISRRNYRPFCLYGVSLTKI